MITLGKLKSRKCIRMSAQMTYTGSCGVHRESRTLQPITHNQHLASRLLHRVTCVLHRASCILHHALLPVIILAMSNSSIMAGAPTVLGGTAPHDCRLEPLKDLNGYFPFTPVKSKSEWAERAELLRRRLQVAVGLWPMPKRTPLRAVIHGRIELDDYSIEKVYFESMPGFYVTGNLYRPLGKSGLVPGVISPHGHWPNGRFYQTPADQLKLELGQGAEQFEQGGRSPLQARCVQLARMGCVVFHYDMIGYADSVQISLELGHRFAKQRSEMNRAENWGLYSPAAESHLQSVMGLQTFNSVRALDFISELPDVDTSRLAVTGASGGGTQTFLLCALDERPATCFPAVMVSTTMQGGCTCENACLLRIGTGNVEMAALFAPKPQLLSAADDWTVEMRSKGFPELQQHYQLLGSSENVALVDRTEFKHNYNSVSRHAMYHWFNRHLNLGLDEPIEERDYRVLSAEEMTVWGDSHAKPQGGSEYERQLLRVWHEDTQQQLAALTPHDAESFRQYRQVVGGALDVILGRQLPPFTDLEYEETYKQDHGDYLHMQGLLRNKPQREELPTAYLYPTQWNGCVVVWLDKAGKAGLFDTSGNPRLAVRRLLKSGAAVVGVDLLMQGEFLTDGQPLERTRRVANERESAAYTFGYNDSLFAKRVHDVLTVLSFVKHNDRSSKEIIIVGIEGAGHWAGAAYAQANGAVDAAAIDTQGFRFAALRDIHHPDFLPGGAKYGDLPGMLAVATPRRLWLAGEDTTPSSLVTAAYTAMGAEDQLTISSPTDNTATTVADWLTREDN